MKYLIGLVLILGMIAIPVVTACPNANTTFYGPFNATGFNDFSGKAHSVTVVGNATVNTTNYKFGGAAYSGNGSPNYLSMPDSDDWNASSRNISISGWIWCNSNDPAISHLFVGQSNTSSYSPVMIGEYIPYKQYTVLISSTGSSWLNTAGGAYLSNVTVLENAWNYVKMTRDISRSSDQYRLWVNGTLVWNYTSTATLWNSPDPMYIGYYAYSSGITYLNGSMDDIVIQIGGPVSDGYSIPTREFVNNPLTMFSSNVTAGTAPLSVAFTDHTNDTATAWNWSYTNWTSTTPTVFSTSQNPTYSFPVGNYTVTLNASNQWGFDTNTSIINVTSGGGPIALFSLNSTEGCAPMDVLLTDSSFINITSRNITWGDGSLSNSTIDTEFMHTYSTGGIFTVTEYVTNASGTNSTSVNVTVYKISADFSGTPVYGPRPLTVAFTDLSSGSPTVWNWSFGDGNYSTSQNPVYTYPDIGTYTVSLNASNLLCQNTTMKADYITTTYSGELVYNPLLVPYYNFTLSIVDANNLTSLNGVSVTYTSGSTTATVTVDGSRTLSNLDYGTLSVTASKTGYATQTQTFVVDDVSTSGTMYLTPGISNTYTNTIFYTPSQVRFVFQDYYGNRISGLAVNATPNQLTAPSYWTQGLFGINNATNILTTNLSGFTGTDGSITFPMLASIQYDLRATNISQGINYTFSLSPTQTEYIITLPTGALAIPTYNASVIQYSLQNTTIDGTWGNQTINMSYVDTTLGTSSLTFIVYNSSRSIVVSITYTGTSANSATFNYTYLNITQTSTWYTYSLQAYNANYGWLNESITQTDPSIGLIPGVSPGWPEQWLAIALIIILAAVTSIFSVSIMMIIIPIFAWFLKYYIGWLQLGAGADIGFVIILVLGVLLYVRSRENLISTR